MKTFNHLYPPLTAFENLFTAFRRAARGKRRKEGVADFEFNLEENLFTLQEELLTRTYRPGGYRHFNITDPKLRRISAAPFRDRVVHHALCQVIEPIFERRFIHDSYACRVGRGTHAALDRAQQFSRRFPYVLQCDIQHFFPCMDHAILKQLLAHVIADADTLWLCEQIIDSGAGIHPDDQEAIFFSGDNLLSALRPRGMPIGNLTSQFWANVFLNPLDQFIKRDLKCQGYLRYVDDVRRRETAYEETQRRVNVREKRFKAPTLSRPGNRLGSVAWWERPEFCNPRQTTEGQARLDMARAKLPKDQFRAVIA